MNTDILFILCLLLLNKKSNILMLFDTHREKSTIFLILLLYNILSILLINYRAKDIKSNK